MNFFAQKDGEEITDALLNSIEEQTGKKIFTMRVINETEEGLDVIVVFTDKNILNGCISVQVIDGNLACRIRGNYL